MPNTYTIEKLSGMHYLMLEEKTVAALTKNGNKRAICSLNNQLDFHCAVMPRKEGGHYVVVGQKICKQLGIKQGSIVTVTFSIDDSEYQFEMPEELKEVLNQDPQADKVFHSLTAGNQRGLIHLVAQVKSTDKRIERALKIAERVKSGITSPMKVLKTT